MLVYLMGQYVIWYVIKKSIKKINLSTADIDSKYGSDIISL